MIRTILALTAVLLAPFAWARPCRTAEGAMKRLERDLPDGHRAAVRERADSGYRSSARSHSADDDDDDDDGIVAAIVGGLFAGFVADSDSAEVEVRPGRQVAPSGGGDAPAVEVRGGHALFDEDEEALAPEDSAGPPHPWTAYGQGMMCRINLGVARYDDRDLREAASYEWQLHARVVGTWGMGVTLGGGWGTIGQAGSLSRGTLETGLVLASTNVDIPLGRGQAPILSLGGGIGGFYADPDPASDLREDLEALGLRLDQGHHWFLDKRVRADLLIPLDSERHAFLGLGAARDWADGTITTTLRDEATGTALSKDTAHMDFDRTTFQLSLVMIF